MAYFESNSGSALVRIYRMRKYPEVEEAECYGRIYAWHGSVVNARDLGMKTILDLVMTAENSNLANFYVVNKYLHNPGQVDNYASIWIRDVINDRYVTSGVGSIWINFYARGQ